MSLHLDKTRKPMRNTQMEGLEERKPSAKARVGSFCIFVQVINAGQPPHELGLADNPFEVEVYRMIYV